MPQRSFALERGGPKRLEISWKGIWKEVTVKFDGQTVGVIPDQKALSAGQTFNLGDGSTVDIRLARKAMTAELQVSRNGQPLPGSASDPKTRIAAAYGVVFLVAGLNLALGLASLLFKVAFLRQMGIGLGSIIFGLVFLLLGYLVQRKSLIALILAILIFVADGVIGFVLAASQGYQPGGSGFIVRLFLLIPMIQGIGAIKTLKKGNG